MSEIQIMSELASLGAAGVMGAMWLWERRTSNQRESQLSETHARILRDEQRLDKFTEVVEQNTSAIARFHEIQRETCEVLKHMHEELHHEAAK